MRKLLVCVLILPLCVLAGEPERRQALETLLKVLPPTSARITGRVSAVDQTWEDWVKRTGELPPDFDAMPSVAELPDPLVLRNAHAAPIASLEQWKRQRQWIRAQVEQWVFGKMPPAPGNLRAVVTATRREGDVTVRDVRLEFGPGRRAGLRVQLLIPPGKGPFPVFLTNHPRTRPWVNTAVRRGYLACIYFAADPMYGNDDDSDKFIEVYPDYDFSCLARWAWAGMRAVDYLVTLPEVDKARVGISGHSRNGKQALLAAAFDERIAAAVPSSGNTGEHDPWRYTTPMFVNESIEQITGNFPHWFHPRLRFFVGREHKLPVDQNLLMALVAPRGLMMYSSYSETQGNGFGFEQAYRSVRRVYRFLGREQNLALRLRDGEHPTTAGDIEEFLDFFDTVFGRKTFARPATWVHGYTFDGWRKISGESLDPLRYPRRAPGDFLRAQEGRPVETVAQWEEQKKSLRERVAWALGEEPPGVRFPVRTELRGPVRTSDGWLGLLFGRPLKAKNMAAVELSYGDDLKADLYYPANADGSPKLAAGQKWPVVIWLHPYAYPTGYSRSMAPVFSSLVGRGFAVLAFDQIGFGTRAQHARNFYARYPGWSLMGKMVADTRAAIDAVAALEASDSSRIYLAGYALGAKVGLFTAALDERVKGLAAVCGFRPLRLDAPEKGAEGVRHYSHLHGLLPRLGFFAGQEARLPVDDDELLAMVAPRSVLIVAPELDRYSPVEDVRRGVGESRKAYRLYGREAALELQTPLDFNRFPRDMQEKVFDWLAAVPHH